MTTTTSSMTSYAALFRQREFRALWSSTALGTAASTISSLSLATLVHAETGSALLTALTMFGPSLAQVIGAMTLMSTADTASPRRTLALLSALGALALALQAALALTPTARLLLVLAAAYVLSIGGGVRWGLLTEVLPRDGYALGRSAMNVSVGVMQIVGFAAGGLLLQVLTLRQIFVLAAMIAVLSVPVLWLGLDEHPPRRSGRPGFRATWHGNRVLLGLPSTRPLLLALCIPNGLIVGCEALFVPYAGDDAALLFVAGAAGMLAGDLLVGRAFSINGRRRAAAWLRILLAVPFLAFAWHPAMSVAAVLVVVGCLGYGASIAQQEMLVALTPRELSGQVLGVESATRMTCQGLGAVLAGSLAEALDTGLVMTCLAAASVLVSLALTPALILAARRAGRADEGASIA